LNIYVDLDNTLFNFLRQYAVFYLKDTGISINWDDIHDYNLGKTFNCTKYKYLYDPCFYDDIEEMPMGIEHVNKLHEDGHNIQFCTACVTPQSITSKYNLLERTFKWFDIKQYMVVAKKEYIYDQDGIIVDDSPFLFDNVQMPISICYSWKHNERSRPLVDLYIDDWRRIYDYITERAGNSLNSVEKSLQNVAS